MKFSLFQRLFISISGLLLLLFLLSSILIYHSISDHLNRDKDAQMVNNSHILWDVIKDDIYESKPGSAAIPPATAEDMRKSLAHFPNFQTVRVWKDNTLIFKSGSSELQDMPAAKPDFSEKKFGKDAWRTYAFYVQQKDIIIEVSENLLSRKTLVKSIFEGFLASSVLLLPLLALLLFLCLRYGLQGLTHMERLLEERGPQSLEHINVNTLPKELRPLQQAINFLLGKLKDTILHEKQLIDNAAHELRTPLATLKLHAQLAAQARNESDRKESMQDLFATLADTTLLVEQLLALSRIAAQRVAKSPVSLYAIADKALQKQGASAKQLRFVLQGDSQAASLSHEELLLILLGVLLDNAVKYSPRNGTVVLTVAPDVIEISDSGPGIAQEDRDKVFERFYRGKHEIQGHGLGLAIARQICELLDITITLMDAEGGGLLVRLAFPKSR